ncbi:MAG TPA: helicase-related protein [Nitrososphaerales archaeon]|nr:helicase-related protein [Nitrososphaerales archaeon]
MEKASPSVKGAEPAEAKLPIFAILDSIDFDDHFLILGDVGTGKSTVTPIHEYMLHGKQRMIVIREPSRASCSALYYSLCTLYPEVRDDLAVITKDTKINAERGTIRIVTDGVLLRMLAERSLRNSSIYFDESHQLTSQLELCMSLARRQMVEGNLLRVMSATLDPEEFLEFLGIKNQYTISGRRFPVSIELEMAKDLDEMFDRLPLYLYSQPQNESWLVFLPTRRLVEKYARSYGGVYIHGGLEGSEINKIQERAEIDKNLKVFATNVIASSVNIYVDNVLIFNEEIDGKEKLGQKSLEYRTIDNNSLLQMMGRVGRFKPGRAVLLSDVPVPKMISPKSVRKSLERETPFDLVLLMSKYGLKLSELEFMSKLNMNDLQFAENWMYDVGAIERGTHSITDKGLLMSEIPYEPDYAHVISEAVLRSDFEAARFFLACGAFGDSLNHSYKSEMEGVALEFLYGFDKTNELNIKATLLKKYSEDIDGRFISTLVTNGIFPRFVDEAWKDYEAARESLNDILAERGEPSIEREVLTNVEPKKLAPYLDDCLTFEKYYKHEAAEFGLVGGNRANLRIEGGFYARSITMNYRKILFDIVAMESEA